MVCRRVYAYQHLPCTPDTRLLQVPQHDYRVVGDAGSEKMEIDVHLPGGSPAHAPQGHRSSMHCVTAQVWETACSTHTLFQQCLQLTQLRSMSTAGAVISLLLLWC
jgi:hypothetical protein